MTPTDPTPLSAEELAKVREWIAATRIRGIKPMLLRLLATLDARELDVERLARAMHRWHNPSLSECSDPMGKHGQAAERIAAEYAALSETNHD